MAKARKVQKIHDQVSDSLEGATFYLPPPPRISLYSQSHKELEPLDVGDTITMRVTARITDIDEDGRHGLELATIKLGDGDEKMEKAKGDVVEIGTLTPDGLDALFAGELE